jgi:uncharacterized protein YbjT (DUF2867 family)
MEDVMYVITGATGNTGAVVANQLLDAGKQVRVIGRSADRLQHLIGRGAEPFIADLADRDALTRAFVGAEAVYAMIPPNLLSTDYRAYQSAISDSLVVALQSASVKQAVVLSSIGADKPDQTGPVVALHILEERLNQIGGLKVLYLRAGYFMENTLAQVGLARMGTLAGPLRADLKLPMIATEDIGAAAADALLRLDFQGSQKRELLGHRDLTMSEVAGIIGPAIGKNDLAYVQLPDVQVRGALIQVGMSPSVADAILEMAAALNSGYMRALEPRSPQNTTATSYQTFVTQKFIPAYRERAAA